MKSPRMYRALFVLAILTISQTVFAQEFSIILSAPPPNQMRLADLWRVTLINTSQQARTVYLHGTGEEAKDGFVVDAETRFFSLPAGTKVVTGQFVQPVKVKRSNSRYRGIVENTGTVPSGDYHICVEIVDSASRQVLAKDCFDQRVEQMSPPILQLPDNGETVLDSLPNFSWLPPSPIPLDMASKVRYKLKIVEIYGVQTPQQAMQANPSHFERNDIIPPLFIYPFSARKLEAGKKYAWNITAQFNDGYPIGISEIWSFTMTDIELRSRKKAQDTVENPITGGILSAGDQHSAGVFETKEEQRGTLDFVKKMWDKNGIAKGTILGDKTFTSEYANKNFDATDLNRYASAGGAGSSALGSETITVDGKRTESVSTEGSSDKSLGAVYESDKFKIASDGITKLNKAITDLSVKKDIEGLLWLWGRNYEGQVGFLAPEWYTDVPVPYDIKNIKQVSCGANHTMILLKDGTVWVWGDNQFGQCANTNIREFNYAVQVSSLTNIVQIAAGLSNSYALTQTGDVYSWGYNVSGELGIGSTVSHDTAVPVKVYFYGASATEKVVSIAARGGHALALTNKGNVFAWGSGYFGELGNGSTQTYAPTPVMIIEAGAASSSSRSSFSGFSAGSGDFTAAMMVTPKPVLRTMACGDHHNILVSRDGNTVVSWGRNASGQLGLEHTRDTAKPIQTKMTGIDTVAAGGAHSMAVKSNRTLMLWGNNISGQLGDGSVGIQPVPTELSSFGQTLNITAGAGHSMAIKKAGGLWTWGINNFGQLAISPISDIVLTKKPPIQPTRITLLEK